MLRFFRALDVGPQWLAALTLMAFVAMVASGYVVAGISSPLAEKTGFKLTDLQFSGWYPILSRVPSRERSINTMLASIGFETHPYTEILDALRRGCSRATSEDEERCRREDLLPTARRAQKADFVFAAAYGAFALLLAVALWRGQPEYPIRVRWVWLVALGALAAVFDEIENARLWSVLHGTAGVGFLLPTAAATAKVVLLIAAVVGVVVGVVRAHNARRSAEASSTFQLLL